MAEFAPRALLSALFACLYSAPAAAETRPATPAPIATRAFVVDADGRSLGALIAPNRVLVNFPDGDAVLGVGADGYLTFPDNYPSGLFPKALLFQSGNCSGTPYASPFQTPTLAAFEKGGSAKAGEGSAGAILYAVHKSTRLSIASLALPGWENKCVPVNWSTTTVNAIGSREAGPFRLPLSIAIRRVADAGIVQSAPSGVGVFDARGVYVGNILNQDRLWMKFDDGEALVTTDPTGAFAETTADLYFETADCSGAAWMDATDTPSKASFIPIDTRADIVSKGFIRYPGRPYETVTARSFRKTGSKECSPLEAEPRFVGRASAVRLSGYKPPLTIR